MAILDILNRNESEFISKALKMEVDYFNRDLGLLFSEKVSIVQPSYDYLTNDKVRQNIQNKFVLVTSSWEGDCAGESFMVVKIQDAKIMSGLLMMMGPDDIKETLPTEFSADDQEIFKEIANQINGSMDNALRENFNFDFHATLKDVRAIVLDEQDVFKSVFEAEGYLVVSAVMKFAGFPDSFLYQYIPKEIVQSVCSRQGLDGGMVEKSGSDEGDKSILIVDDDPVVRKIIRGFLKDEGYNLVEANDGVDAMQTLIRTKINLIILDIEMPNMNGFEACKRIKQNPRTRGIPVIMCSSRSSRDNVLEAVNSGARDFVVKPINDKQAFNERIKKYLKQ